MLFSFVDTTKISTNVSKTETDNYFFFIWYAKQFKVEQKQLLETAVLRSNSLKINTCFVCCTLRQTAAKLKKKCFSMFFSQLAFIALLRNKVEIS